MQLSNQQIEKFKTDGFIILKNFTNHNFCDEILQKAHYHLEHKIEPIESEQEYQQQQNNKDNIIVRRLRQVYQREEIFKKWMLNIEIRDILKQLLEDTPVLTLAHHNSIMTKMPNGSTRTFWHQDIRYWSYENSNLISVWLALDDEFIENGLLEFIPKSHTMEFSKEQFDEHSNFLDNHPKNQELIKSKVHTNLKKGDVVLFHCKTLHHANKNSTNKAKISFVYTVKARNNKALQETRSDFDEIVLE